MTAVREFITAPDVAALCGFKTVPAFRANRQRLEDCEGFPKPMPTSRRPQVWRRSAVLAWLEEVETPQQPTAGNVVAMRRARG